MDSLPYVNLPENRINLMYILHNSLDFCNIFYRILKDFLVHFCFLRKNITAARFCGGKNVRHFDDEAGSAVGFLLILQSTGAALHTAAALENIGDTVKENLKVHGKGHVGGILTVVADFFRNGQLITAVDLR